VVKGDWSSSSSLSSGLTKERREEVGVIGGMRGAAMARLEEGRGEVWDQRSGEGVSALRRDAGCEEAEERGRWMGLNSDALALSEREVSNGDAGRDAVHCACACVACVWASTGDDDGE